MEDEDKKQILVAVYKRYEAFEENVKNLTKGLQKIGNDLEDQIEHQEAEKILLDI